MHWLWHVQRRLPARCFFSKQWYRSTHPSLSMYGVRSLCIELPGQRHHGRPGNRVRHRSDDRCLEREKRTHLRLLLKQSHNALRLTSNTVIARLAWPVAAISDFLTRSVRQKSESNDNNATNGPNEISRNSVINVLKYPLN